jgi:hypothetical protein
MVDGCESSCLKKEEGRFHDVFTIVGAVELGICVLTPKQTSTMLLQCPKQQYRRDGTLAVWLVCGSIYSRSSSSRTAPASGYVELVCFDGCEPKSY